MFADASAGSSRPKPPFIWLPVLACALAGLLAPAAASAEIYVVNDTGDAADAAVGSEGCDSVAGGAKQCTLRAAIEESNSSTGADDTVSFDGSLFNGDPSSDKIVISGAFPAITDEARIDGDLNGEKAGQCEPLTGILGPCVGVEKSGGGFGLVVEADEVTIEGLAVTGALIGISVINASEGFVARNNWVGLKLDGSAGANNTGLFIDPNSDKATIGGTDAAQRNVFAFNNNEGLDIEGASGAVVRGNYFGVKPDGVTQAGNGKNLELTDSTAGGGFKAEENEIGGGVSPAQAATTGCDGGCNVISGSLSVGIDMSGTGANEAPPTGPTAVQGNFVGFNAVGGAVVQNTTTGILVGGADNALIGGFEVGEGNLINGGSFGVMAEGAKDLLVAGNLIGVNPVAMATVSPPSTIGIFVSGNGITSEEDEVAIIENLISMQGGVAIEQHAYGALIAANTIGRSGSEPLSGGTTGIRLYGDDSLLGNTVVFNTIENTGGNGVLIENDSNLVILNLIADTGAAGVRIQSFGGVLPSTGNVIGGGEEGEENGIFESAGDAIEVAGAEDDGTQIGQNVGAENEGLFIDLGADGPGNKASGPNDGIQAPAISKATVSGASGAGARPGATVRIFRKATASPGEIASFLGEATADGGGKWSLAYGSDIPGGTRIAATQSEAENGTSELSATATTAMPLDSGGKGKGKGKADKKAPETRIVKGPKAKTRKRTAKFRFVSSEPGSTFECKLDRKRFRPCRSPRKYKRLKPGKHVFKVRAIDAAGNVDKSPAKRKFRVLRPTR